MEESSRVAWRWGRGRGARRSCEEAAKKLQPGSIYSRGPCADGDRDGQVASSRSDSPSLFSLSFSLLPHLTLRPISVYTDRYPH